MRLADNVLPKNPGEFSWQIDTGPRRIALMLPCGHGPVIPVEGSGVTWTWYGNEDEPTLTPSLQCLSRSENAQPAPCWHGYLTNGVMTSV
jgi:hypothetical protein